MTKLIATMTLAAGLIASLQAGTPAPMPPAKGPAPAPPAPNPFSGSITIGYDTDYVYRGYQVLGADGEKAKDLIWGALDLNYAINDRLSWNLNTWYADSQDADYSELDVYTRLTYKVNDVFSFGPSFKWYHYPDYGSEIDNQYELGLEGFIVPCPNTTVYLGAFYETEAGQWYGELGISYTLKITEHFALVPGAVLSFIDVDDEAFGLDESGAHHASAYLKAPISFGRVTVTPYVQGNFPIGSQVDDFQDDIVYGGVNVSFTF